MLLLACEELGLEEKLQDNSFEVNLTGQVVDVVSEKGLDNTTIHINGFESFTTDENGSFSVILPFDDKNYTYNKKVIVEKANFLQDETYELLFSETEPIKEQIFSLEQNLFVEVDKLEIDLGLFETTSSFRIINNTARPVDFSISSSSSLLAFSPKNGTINNSNPSLAYVICIVNLDRSESTNGPQESEVTIKIDNEDFAEIYVSYEIRNSEDLQWVDEDHDGLVDIRSIDDLYRLSLQHHRDTFNAFLGFELMQDLDFYNTEDYKNTSLQTQLLTGEGWMPIGLAQDEAFAKHFEGNGFVISNLYINRDTNYIGLFSSTSSSASIDNLTLDGIDIIGNTYVAGIVGWNRADINNCSANGSVKGEGAIGLLIGRHAEGDLLSCYSTGGVQGSNNHIGGLIGNVGHNNSDQILIKNCFSTAIVKGNQYVGGLLGGRYSSQITIQSCYALGSVLAQNQYVGGLIGSFNGVISNCYAKGDVSSNGYYIGGLIGQNTGLVESSFSVGKVTGSSNDGGLIGRNTGNVANSNYWDIETSEINESAGGSGYKTALLQGITSDISIYLTWDEESWDFGNTNQYPVLKNMPLGLQVQQD